MKKLFILVLLSLITLYSTAQLRMGVKAGVNLSTIKYSFDNPAASVDNNYGTSFHFGGLVELKLGPMLYFQPGLLINGQTSKFTEGTEETKVDLMYLTIPVNFGTRVNLGAGSVSFGAGPYFSYALSGKFKDATESGDIKFGNTVDDMMKPTDFGLNVNTGFEFRNGFNIGLGYNLGLSDNTPKDNSDGVKTKNSNISISLGYNFKL